MASADLPIHVPLDDEQLRRLARFIAQELDGLYSRQPAMLSAADVATQYGLSRGWVYRNARKLGGQRLGNGPKARIRFRATEVQRRLAKLQDGDRAENVRRTLAPRGGVELMPIGPRRASRRMASRNGQRGAR